VADHAPVMLLGGNHEAELEGDLHVFGRPKASG
jgi:hypothetical protein